MLAKSDSVLLTHSHPFTDDVEYWNTLKEGRV